MQLGEYLANVVAVGAYLGKSDGMKELTIVDMQNVAAKRSGWCRSTKYVNAHSKLLWECSNAHQWLSTPSNTKYLQRWCPICAIHISETICRQYFEALFGTAFPKIRPGWLINQNGNCLELDGFSSELKIAFEYNGIQHYEEVKRFTRVNQTSSESLRKRISTDRIKRKTCEKNGIQLIEIPYTVSHAQMGKYILTKCHDAGIVVPNSKLNIDIRQFKSYQNDRIEKLAEILKARATPTHIKSGTGCYVCKRKVAAVKSGISRRKISFTEKIIDRF